MIVHSFAQDNRWADAFSAFCAYLGAFAGVGRPATIMLADGMPLTLGWAKGPAEFLAA